MIALSNISKEFIIRPKSRNALFNCVIRTLKKQGTRDKMRALDNVTLKIEKGETMGLIGPNGSGKSTLLKIISGIYKPTSGTVRIGGKVVPVLRLGLGFLPDLSVRDNIFLYGAVIGLDRESICENFKKIIDFADLENFTDIEVRTLSSGMEERLAFSVVLQSSADILLFDETFAVGDRGFMTKGLESVNEYKKQGKTIILASHDLNIIRGFCDRVLFLDEGKVIAFGKADEIVDIYMNFGRNDRDRI